jgi:hypothetical protein
VLPLTDYSLALVSRESRINFGKPLTVSSRMCHYKNSSKGKQPPEVIMAEIISKRYTQLGKGKIAKFKQPGDSEFTWDFVPSGKKGEPNPFYGPEENFPGSYFEDEGVFYIEHKLYEDGSKANIIKKKTKKGVDDEVFEFWNE